MISAAALAILVLSLAIFVLARSRSIASADGVLRNLHSRPSYHGVFCGLWTALIGLVVLIAASLISGAYIVNELYAYVAANAPDLSAIQQDLVVSDARAIADGPGDVDK